MHAFEAGDPRGVPPPVPQDPLPVLVDRHGPGRARLLLGQLLGPVGQRELRDLGGVVVAVLGPLGGQGNA